MFLCTVHILHLKCALCLRCIKKFKATHAQRRAVPNTLRYPFLYIFKVCGPAELWDRAAIVQHLKHGGLQHPRPSS